MQLRIFTLTPSDDEIVRALLASNGVKIVNKTASFHIVEIDSFEIEKLTQQLKDNNVLFEIIEPPVSLEISEVPIDYGSDTIFADIPEGCSQQLGDIRILDRVGVTRYKLRLPTRAGRFPKFQNVTIFDPMEKINLSRYKHYNVKLRDKKKNQKYVVQSLLKANCEVIAQNDTFKVCIFSSQIPDVLTDSSIIDDIEPDVPATVC